MTRLGIWFMRAIAPLPLPWLRAFGQVIGRLLFVLAQPRRHVALTNLRLCFPDWSEARRREVARRSFIFFSQAFLDRAWVWHAAPDLVRQRIRMTGALDALREGGAVICFAPHFYGMDAGGSAIMQQAVAHGSSIYTRQSDPVVDAWLRAGRLRFGDVILLHRDEGLKPIVRSLREGRWLYLLPDMDFGPEDSIFVPFFGVPAATVPSLSRFARLGAARVVPFITRMTPQGYEVEVLPEWENYPSGDIEADTLLMNQRLEGYIRSTPEQYYWVHKRFKTRPPGEPSVY
jgi:KDO2-lipid IV(A) lauroyltransferase